MDTKSENHKNDKRTVEKICWKAPELIKLDVEETEAKSKMFMSEFNMSYGLS